MYKFPSAVSGLSTVTLAVIAAVAAFLVVVIVVVTVCIVKKKNNKRGKVNILYNVKVSCNVEVLIFDRVYIFSVTLKHVCISVTIKHVYISVTTKNSKFQLQSRVSPTPGQDNLGYLNSQTSVRHH